MDIWIQDDGCDDLRCRLSANGTDVVALHMEAKAFAPNQKVRIHCNNGKLMRYSGGAELDSLVLKPSGAERRSKTLTCYFKSGDLMESSVITALVNKLQSPPITIDYEPSCPGSVYFVDRKAVLIRNSSDPVLDTFTVKFKVEGNNGFATRDLDYKVDFVQNDEVLEILPLGPYELSPKGWLYVKLSARKKDVAVKTRDVIEFKVRSNMCANEIATSNSLIIEYE